MKSTTPQDNDPKSHDFGYDTEHDYLKRLPPEPYRGQAYVHWSMTLQDRKTGWLIPIFYYKFREILTHTLFRSDCAVQFIVASKRIRRYRLPRPTTSTGF